MSFPVFGLALRGVAAAGERRCGSAKMSARLDAIAVASGSTDVSGVVEISYCSVPHRRIDACHVGVSPNVGDDRGVGRSMANEQPLCRKWVTPRIYLAFCGRCPRWRL